MRELDLKPMINTALQKAIVPFVRDQVNASVKARNAGQGGWPRQQTAGQPTQFGNRQWQGPGKGGGRGTGLPPPAIGDGYFGHRKNRMGHPVTCYECQVTGHFAWECPRAGIPASGGGEGGHHPATRRGPHSDLRHRGWATQTGGGSSRFSGSIGVRAGSLRELGRTEHCRCRQAGWPRKHTSALGTGQITGPVAPGWPGPTIHHAEARPRPRRSRATPGYG